MVSETKILEAIFGPSIPTDQAAILPEIMAHIRAIDGLLGGRYKDALARQEAYAALSGSAPAWESEPILYANKDFSATPINPPKQEQDAQKEAYAAISGSANPGAKELPIELPATFGQFIPHESPVDPIVDPNPGQAVAQRPDDHQIIAMKAEAIKLHRAGKDVKAIAEKLGVRWQWVRSVIAKATPHNEGSIIRETPRIVTTEPPKQQEPEKKVPLNAIDARVLEMADQGAMVHEICIAIQRNFSKNYSTSEMAEKIRKLHGEEL